MLGQDFLYLWEVGFREVSLATCGIVKTRQQTQHEDACDNPGESEVPEMFPTIEDCQIMMGDDTSAEPEISEGEADVENSRYSEDPVETELEKSNMAEQEQEGFQTLLPCQQLQLYHLVQD